MTDKTLYAKANSRAKVLHLKLVEKKISLSCTINILWKGKLVTFKENSFRDKFYFDCVRLHTYAIADKPSFVFSISSPFPRVTTKKPTTLVQHHPSFSLKGCYVPVGSKRRRATTLALPIGHFFPYKLTIITLRHTVVVVAFIVVAARLVSLHMH